MFFILQLILIIVLPIVALGFILCVVFYVLPKKLGHHNAGHYMTTAILITSILGLVTMALEDQLFTASDANRYLKHQDIELNDLCYVVSCRTSSAIGDYYHRFELQISEDDRLRLIGQIKDSPDFTYEQEACDMFILTKGKEETTCNCEDDNYIVTNYFKPSDQEGYAPTFRRVSIHKTENRLIFEDIDE